MVKQKVDGTVWTPQAEHSGIEEASAETNLGCSAIRWGPLYVDRYNDEGENFKGFYLNFDIGVWGFKLRLTTKEWTLEASNFASQGFWK